jgi:hypothetical protein
MPGYCQTYCACPNIARSYCACLIIARTWMLDELLDSSLSDWASSWFSRGKLKRSSVLRAQETWKTTTINSNFQVYACVDVFFALVCVLQFYEREHCRFAVAMAGYSSIPLLHCTLCPFRKGTNFLSTVFCRYKSQHESYTKCLET